MLVAPLALQEKTIGLGVTGGIAAYKAVLTARLLMEAGASVHVIMTKTACDFVTPLTFAAITGNPVFTDLLDSTQEQQIGHIALADRLDLLLIAPATADTIARLAHGRADDALTATALATRAPVVVAPAMNVNMWQHPATRENIATLETRGVHIVPPETGHLACSWVGAGRLAEPSTIVTHVRRALTPKDWHGKRVLITAGPTHEWIDPVRYVSNPSTGKMGYALAEAAQSRGAHVVLVSGPTSLPCPLGVELVKVQTALEMQGAVKNAYANGCDVLIATAAVGDFRAKTVAGQKIKRGDKSTTTVELVQNPDILAGVAQARGKVAQPYLVGFAAETEHHLDNARRKLATKRCDLIVANDVGAGRGFAADDNALILVTTDDAIPLERASKPVLAGQLLTFVRGQLDAGTVKPTARNRSLGKKRSARA